jgi:hypothetical protein
MERRGYGKVGLGCVRRMEMGLNREDEGGGVVKRRVGIV